MDKFARWCAIPLDISEITGIHAGFYSNYAEANTVRSVEDVFRLNPQPPFVELDFQFDEGNGQSNWFMRKTRNGENSLELRMDNVMKLFLGQSQTALKVDAKMPKEVDYEQAISLLAENLAAFYSDSVHEKPGRTIAHISDRRQEDYMRAASYLANQLRTNGLQDIVAINSDIKDYRTTPTDEIQDHLREIGARIASPEIHCTDFQHEFFPVISGTSIEEVTPWIIVPQKGITWNGVHIKRMREIADVIEKEGYAVKFDINPANIVLNGHYLSEKFFSGWAKAWRFGYKWLEFLC